MRSAKEFANKITNWDLTNTSVKPHLPDMPQVVPLQVELEGVIGEGRALDSQQELARSQARDFNTQRRDIEKRGENLRRRIASHLRGTFGFTSEHLIQFGINPRPRNTRRKKAEEKPAPEPTAAK